MRPRTAKPFLVVAAGNFFTTLPVRCGLVIIAFAFNCKSPGLMSPLMLMAFFKAFTLRCTSLEDFAIDQ